MGRWEGGGGRWAVWLLSNSGGGGGFVKKKKGDMKSESFVKRKYERYAISPLRVSFYDQKF